MPQMAPIWWTFMMIMFNVMFIILMTKIYFNKTHMDLKNFNFKKNKMNWSW
uniref:ATP synthase complex subunit 8 n=1 Tax=Signoretia aureola TaxID=2901393 RepID=A0A8K2ATY9_9HEMI|nr:ATP synthase F0 subunit 8 [Signoretia aureola]